MLELGELEKVEQKLLAALEGAGRQPVDPREERQRLSDRKVGVECLLLWHVPQRRAGYRVPRSTGWFSKHVQPPSVGPQPACDAFEEGGLATARWAEQTVDLAAGQREVEPLEHLDRLAPPLVAPPQIKRGDSINSVVTHVTVTRVDGVDGCSADHLHFCQPRGSLAESLGIGHRFVPFASRCQPVIRQVDPSRSPRPSAVHRPSNRGGGNRVTP
mmetsp:Transcript_4495/g.13662  ORF Transcript_4495/g.13662 Transcript_4495/m.13662 type:complete len:215 (+) Transcript_4495:318-962(+)